MFPSGYLSIVVLGAFICSQANGAGGCPNGKPMVNCFVAPCDVNKCSAFPNAQCRDDYCGGCNARFFVGAREVTSECSGGRPRRNPQECPMIKCAADQVVQCKMEPCNNKKCPRRPNAKCCNSYCGGCRWSFHENFQDVTSQC